MIKRIELINFMSHRHTVVEPASGLTVLVGPNNCGKSALVTALQVLCHNSTAGYALRHGEKKSEVIVETIDGHVVHWSRKKNGSGVYNINGKTYDRLRGKVPDELHQILKMPKVQCDKDEFDIHFGEQTDPVFLLRDRGRAAAQFFASSSDATHLVAMQHEHRSNVTVAKRDAKQLTARQAQLAAQLDTLSSVDQIDADTQKLEQQFQDINQQRRQAENLHRIVQRITKKSKQLQRFSRLSATASTLTAPPKLQNDKRLEKLIVDIHTNSQRLKQSQACSTSLRAIIAPPTLQPDGTLQRLTTKLRTAIQRKKSAVQLTQTLEKLSPPPKLDDEKALIRLTRQMQTRLCEWRLAESSFDSLQELSSLPALTDTRPLATAIADLKLAQTNLSNADQRIQSIQDLSPPPAAKDVQPISKLWEKITNARQQLEQRNQLLVHLEQKLAQQQQQIQQWVADHPICPTCGGPTSAEQMIDSFDPQDGATAEPADG